MCAKGQRRCPSLLQIRDEALEEWTRAETLRDVRVAWARLVGRCTLHRYGSEQFAQLEKLRRRAAVR